LIPEDAIESYGKRVVHRLADAVRAGAEPSRALQSIWTRRKSATPQTGTNVAHNPQSNMNNAVGAAGVLRC
jgi:cytosine/adenosine deaminase-related metal-dependent hydrolase